MKKKKKPSRISCLINDREIIKISAPINYGSLIILSLIKGIFFFESVLESGSLSLMVDPYMITDESGVSSWECQWWGCPWPWWK
jgi:hypothetical protein